MTDGKYKFPQIPATVWWGLKEKFLQKVPAKVDETYIAAQLGVQPTAARAYLSELKSIGLLDNDGKPAPIAKKWRMDATYREACDELLKQAYPIDLLEFSHPSQGERDKVVDWIMHAADLGSGSAKNKAATYFMIGAANIPDGSVAPKAKAASKTPKKSATSNSSGPKTVKSNTNGNGSESELQAAPMPLNVNVQIHISADATTDQIESIFQNMNKYLRG